MYAANGHDPRSAAPEPDNVHGKWTNHARTNLPCGRTMSVKRTATVGTDTTRG